MVLLSVVALGLFLTTPIANAQGTKGRPEQRSGPITARARSAPRERVDRRARILNRATALAILKENAERLLIPQPFGCPGSLETISIRLNVRLYGVQATDDELSGRKPIDYSALSALPKREYTDAKLLDQLAKVGILRQESVYNLPAQYEGYPNLYIPPAMNVSYDTVPNPDVASSNPGFGAGIIWGRYSFTQVTGIAQSGTTAAVDAIISATPTETALRVLSIVHKLLQQEGIDQAELVSFFDNAHYPGTIMDNARICYGILSDEQQHYRYHQNRGHTWRFALYDDGWRVGGCR